MLQLVSYYMCVTTRYAGLTLELVNTFLTSQNAYELGQRYSNKCFDLRAWDDPKKKRKGSLIFGRSRFHTGPPVAMTYNNTSWQGRQGGGRLRRRPGGDNSSNKTSPAHHTVPAADRIGSAGLSQGPAGRGPLNSRLSRYSWISRERVGTAPSW